MIHQKPCFEFHGEFQDGCRVCLRWRDDPRYAELRNGTAVAPAPVKARPVINLPCIYKGPQTGEKIGCQSCKGNVQLTLFACQIHGTCTLGKRVSGHGCCDDKCAERVAPS